MALPVPRAVRVALGLARLCALVVCAIGALALASWQFDLTALDPLFPDLHSMAPNAAAGSIAAGIGLFCLTFRGLRPIAWIIGVLLVLLGGATVRRSYTDSILASIACCSAARRRRVESQSAWRQASPGR